MKYLIILKTFNITQFKKECTEIAGVGSGIKGSDSGALGSGFESPQSQQSVPFFLIPFAQRPFGPCKRTS